MNPEHLTCYRTLGVTPGCSWQQLRERYRLLAKQWHPDHFEAKAEGGEDAEEKIKEINQAFFVLSRYHRAHGRLPLSEDESYNLSDNFDNTTPVPPSAAATDTRTTHESAYAYQSSAHNETPSRQAHPHLWLGGFAVAAALVYFLLAPPEPDNVVLPTAVVAPTQIPSLGNPANPVAASERHFTIGSSLGEVQAIQGVPTRVEADIWYYGDSAIWFRDGRVHRWKEEPGSILKARIDMPEPVRARVFRVGSTMHEVRAIQGKPTHEGENVWDYGVSRVYFKGERVAGWDNSPLNPLKVRR